MQDWRKVGKKLLFPPVWIITLLTVICTVAPVAIYDNTHRSRNQCDGCHNGNLYDCTDDQRN